MTYLFLYIVSAAWITFVLVWLISAFSAKRSVRTNWLAPNILIRLFILVIVIVLIHFQLVSHEQLASLVLGRVHSLVVQGIGTALVVLGIAFAIWARFYLGRNWGMPMTKRAEPGLVTSGPYRYVRHPIYTGMIVALVGTALAVDYVWFVAFAIAVVYFIYSARQEEKFLLQQFPNQYPDYMKRSKMLVPFIF